MTGGLPGGVEVVIVGAGIHGLSTAWHLAMLRGSGEGILVLDKSGVGAGASGIACGVVRNNYFQPAMRELMAHSVEVWESDAEAFSYHSVGYLQISPAVMRAGIEQIHAEQRGIGYDSELVVGARESAAYMRGIVDDWRAPADSVLHEKRGGYANNMASMRGLAAKARAAGVALCEGVAVTGFARSSQSGAVVAVETDKGRVACEQVVVAAGPWVRTFWDYLGLPGEIEVAPPPPPPSEMGGGLKGCPPPTPPIGDGGGVKNSIGDGDSGGSGGTVPMWRYWALQEGVLAVPPETQQTPSGGMPPVIHLDCDEPLYADTVDGAYVDTVDGGGGNGNGGGNGGGGAKGELLRDKMWGIYYKPDLHFGGVQGGAAPYEVMRPAAEVRVDPYGPKSEEFIVGADFAKMWTSALAFCQKRFAGKGGLFRDEPSGGIGCFTADSFPVFDRFCGNAYFVADSNHGYKMLGVGKLVAAELCGKRERLLEPFRFSRYAEGRTHPRSKSPFPWS